MNGVKKSTSQLGHATAAGNICRRQDIQITDDNEGRLDTVQISTRERRHYEMIFHTKEQPMKWMWGTVVVVAVSSAAGAQSVKDMSKRAKDEKLRTTYTGCIEAVNNSGTFMLTHIGDDRMDASAGSMTMKKGDPMMNKDEPMADTNMPAMAPSALVLTGSSDLKKLEGQKVSVTGSLSTGPANTMRDDVQTLTVSSLKVVAKSCS
jgi:hypothetical protein